MNPKKPKQFIKPTADLLGETENLVLDVVNFYWAAVRKELYKLESPSVTVTNLGTFKVRYKRISVLEKKYNNFLKDSSMDKMTFDKHNVHNKSLTKLKKLEELRTKMQEEYERKAEVKKQRQEYVIKSLEK
jgi:hypothetical protein|tara:strand:- start:63 stop:455 length:393 start_codon:yes stop_codon:yes gene_type:complete